MNEQTLNSAADYIKSWLQYHYDRGDTPGFVVAIAVHGKVIMNEAYGFADLVSKRPMTPQHLFRIASHSKTFTATAVMQLQEQGKLRIDDHISDYLPWLKQHKDKRWHEVTIRQLLSHGAGVIRDGVDSDYWNVVRQFPSEPEFKKEILKSDLVIDNNTRLKYSNYGYTLLGMLITQVSGQPYSGYVTEKIIRPLGLKDTGPEYDPELEEQYVTGYSRKDDTRRRLPIGPIDTKAMAPATGFYSNAEDLCRYFAAHMPGSGKLLSDESKREMQRGQWEAEHTDIKEGYGLGLEYEHIGERRVLGHGGGFPGNITKSNFDPKDGLTVIVLTNANGSWAGYIDRSIIKVIDYFLKNRADAKWQKYEGRYMDLWWDADIVAAGNKLVAASAESWEPFDNPAELEYVKGNSFKIAKTDSWTSADETVEFIPDAGGRIKSMVYAGATMLPEDIYLQHWHKKSKID